MTDDLHVGACPNDEQLAAYAEGLLSGEERLAVERHLAECETCREVVAEAVRLQAEPLPVRVLPFWKRPKVRAIGGGVLALAASLILVVQLRPEWNPFQRGSTYGDLVSAVGARRPIEARLTGGFEYGPRPSASRSNDARTADYTVLAAAARIQAEAARQPTAQNLHALGVAHLVLAEYDRAILALEKAVELERLQPVSYSDLAAAYLARAQRQNRPTDFPKAVAAAEKALTSPGAPSEAYFNRALALEALNLRASAMSAWKEYLKIDPSGPWSDEARARLRDLERKEGSLLWPAIRDQVLSGRVETARSVLPAMVRPVRLILEDELLPKWAELYLAGGRHQETMKEARELAVLLDAATASRTASRYVDAISLAFRSADRVQSLAEGHALYGAARRLYENDSVAQARVKFLESEAHLRSGGSPLAGWARLHVGIADYYSGQTDGAFEQFGALLNKDAVTTDPILRGRAAWMSGLVRSSRGDLEGALADYGTALRQFEGANDIEDVVGVRRLIWEVHRLTGDDESAWIQGAQMVAHLGAIVDARRRHSVLITLGQGALELDLAHAAVRFFDEAVIAAESWGQVGAIAEAHMNRSRALVRSGGGRAALKDLNVAEATLIKVSDQALRNRFEIEASVTAAQVDDTDRSISRLNSTIDNYLKLGAHLRLPDLWLARARVSLRHGHESAAYDDLLRAVEEFGRQRSLLTDSELRSRSLAEGSDLFDALVSFHVDRRVDAVAAARAIDLYRADRNEPRSTGSLDHLPDGVAAVAFWVQDDRILLLVQRGSEILLRISRVERQELERLVRDQRSLLLQDPEWTPEEDPNARLYRLLITPVRDLLSGYTRVVLVPDRVLNYLSFAALQDPTTNRFLVEDFSLGYAPSVAGFIQRSTRLSQRVAAERSISVLAVAPTNPLFPPLPNAEGELAGVAAVFPEVSTLVGADATAERVRLALRHRSVVHFAGHALADSLRPPMTRLITAPGIDGTSGLYAHELARMDLSHSRLVVLSACGTAAGFFARGEGVLSAARAFIRAGSDVVVASLWDVNDDTGPPLWRHFYREIATGASAADALREAQLSMLRGGDAVLSRPAAWSAYLVSGAAFQSIVKL